MNKTERLPRIKLSPNDVTKITCAEYRRQINPFVVAYTEKRGEDKPLEGTLPTDFVEVAATSIPLLTAEGDGGDEKKSFRETIGDRVYDQLNPTFTADVCAALAKQNCKHCYNSGLQHFSVPERAKWSEACWCVKNRLDKMEKEVEGTKRAILGY